MDGPGLWYILCPFEVSLVCACRRPPRAKCTADRWWWRPRRDSEELGLFCTSRMLSALCPLFRACATLSQPTRERASSRTGSGRQKTTKCERLRAFFQPILLLCVVCAAKAQHSPHSSGVSVAQFSVLAVSLLRCVPHCKDLSS